MRLWGGLFALGAILNILLGWHDWPGVLAGHLNDPDSYMRLERLRQGIAQGHLVNIVARDDAGAGVMVEWSRLLDIVLWLIAAPLSLFAGWTGALFVAGVVSGPLAVGALGVALGFAARPLAADALLWAAAAAAALLPGLASFAAPGVVHYHMALLALIAACAGCVLRTCRGGSTGFGFLSGICGGFAIWLTPETMPFILMAYAAMLLRWLAPGQQVRLGSAMLYCGAGFIDVLGFGIFVDPPQGGYLSTEVDRFSIVYIVLGILVLAGAQILQRLPRWKPGPAGRWIGFGVAAGLILLWIVLFPKVIKGPYGLMSAADRARFFGAMQETQPLHGAAQFLAFLAPGVLALAYTLWRALGRGLTGDARASRWPWLYLAICTLVTLVLADRFLLFAEFPAGVAAALLPVALSEASRRWRARPLAAMAARLAVLAAVLLLPKLPALAGSSRPAGPTYPSCDLLHVNNLLGADRNTIVLAEAQNTPELLYRTPVETVGSLYQHGVPGYLKSWAAWRSPAEAKLPEAVRATGAKLVLFCSGAGRYAPVQNLPATTLWDALQANHPPPWLSLRNADAKTGWRVYAVHG